MKKHLLILSATIFAFNAFKVQAQMVHPVISPTADDFDVWAPDPANNSIKDPNNSGVGTVGWQCLNPMTYALLGGSPQTVFQDSTTVHSGNYSCRIVSQVLTSASYNYVKSFIPHDTVGVVLAATFQITPSVKIKPGAPFTSVITQFSFWYQYAPQKNNGIDDTAFCSISLTRHVNNHSKVLSTGYMKMNAAASWTNAVINLTPFDSACAPDSIQVMFSSSSIYKPAPLSQLIIDGAQPLGINEVVNAQTAQVNVYPNPANGEIHFSITGANPHNIEVYDVTGKKVGSYSIKDNLLNLNTAGYSTGMYIYQLYDKEGGLIKVGKFSVQK